jgi:hypothetical protein
MAQTLAELRAAEAEVAREWQWLHDALNTVARVRAENGDAAAFRLMQSQAMRVGQRRIELSLRIAELEGDGTGNPCAPALGVALKARTTDARNA